MKKDAKIVIKSLLFIVINCHIYVNHIKQFRIFYFRKEYTLLIFWVNIMFPSN